MERTQRGVGPRSVTQAVYQRERRKMRVKASVGEGGATVRRTRREALGWADGGEGAVGVV